jgi:hypothetical protein
MWEGVDDNQATKHDLTWLVEGMIAGSVIWVTDGSYDRLKASDVSGAGWIIFCTSTGKRLTGWFWEVSNTASSYRAEMLGLCALHLLSQAISELDVNNMLRQHQGSAGHVITTQTQNTTKC